MADQLPMFDLGPPPPAASADVEDAYRYRLMRRWGAPEPRVCWVMLNPSTADASADDPTIRRCVDFSASWGYGALEVVNLFALRSTDPRTLAHTEDPVGPRNDASILAAATLEQTLVVCAWGAGGGLRDRDQAVLAMLRSHGVRLHYLALTKGGQPGHPLYLPKTTTPTLWTRRHQDKA